MIDYLTSKPLALPKSLASAAAPKVDEGTLTTNLKAGVVFLEDAKGLAYRLSWSQDEAGDARARALPAGEYKLRTYRVLKQDAGRSWHLSSSAPTIQKLTIRAGQEHTLKLDQRIHINARIHGKQAQMGIKGHEAAGLSIYRDGVRIPIRYSLNNSAGESLASGAMNYG